ncbi:hypothetical protein MTR67_048506, partial [Solanum verrucosum]
MVVQSTTQTVPAEPSTAAPSGSGIAIMSEATLETKTCDQIGHIRLPIQAKSYVIHGKNEDEHVEHLRIVLRILKDHELYAKLIKCEFWLRSIDFLGHITSCEGIQVDPKKQGDIFTDHKNLKYVFTQKDLILRQKICLELLKNYDMSFLYHLGKENVVEDSLSRLSMGSVTDVEDDNKELVRDVHRLDVKAKKDLDPVLVQLKKSVSKKAIQAFSQEGIVSFNIKYSIHPRDTKIYRDLREVYRWNGMKKNIVEFVAKCPNYRQVKVEHHKTERIPKRAIQMFTGHLGSFPGDPKSWQPWKGGKLAMNGPYNLYWPFREPS